jgi:hypothetical protein
LQKVDKSCSIEKHKISEIRMKSPRMLSAKYQSKVSTESSMEIEDVSDGSSLESRIEK